MGIQSEVRKGVTLFDGDALGQIAGLVDVTASLHSDVVRQQLKRERDQQWLDPGRRRWNRDYRISLGRDHFIAIRDDRDYPAVPSLDLFDIARHLLVGLPVWCDGDHRHVPVD